MCYSYQKPNTVFAFFLEIGGKLSHYYHYNYSVAIIIIQWLATEFQDHL